jgi:hypothetical protein
MRDDHSSRYDFHSTWADRVALLIVLGLAIDIAAVFIFQRPFLWEGALAVVANLLIALGVWGELWFARRAREAGDAIVAEAKARAATANERTAELELTLENERLARVRIERELAPRYLSAEQYERITEKIRPFAGTPFSLGADLTAEPMFVDMIAALLSLAGRWELRHSPYPDESKEGPQLGEALAVQGIAILYKYESPKKDEWHAAARALDAALNAEGIHCAISPAQPRLADIIHVVIGRKPPFIPASQSSAAAGP